MGFLTHEQLAFIFGILGNIISFMVFLAPVPTFCTIYKKKSSGGFQSIPYAVAFMSATLLLYYGIIKKNSYLIVSINSFGCALEVTYIVFYLIYAPNKEKMFTLKLVAIFNIGGFGSILLLTVLLLRGPSRVTTVGWICALFSVAVFASPLSIMEIKCHEVSGSVLHAVPLGSSFSELIYFYMRVIRTRSVEYMPLALSFFLTISATTWFFYGFLIKDFFLALPNVLGFLFGIAQMVLYLMYKNANKINKRSTEINKVGTTENLCHGDDDCKELKTVIIHDCKPYK